MAQSPVGHSAREWVDAEALAARHAHFVQKIPLVRLARLAESVLSTEGDATLALDFGVLAGATHARGTVSGTVRLRCQRCLEPVDVPVVSDVDAVLVAGDPPAGLPETVEPIAVDPARFDLVAFVEDELLLSLPLVPKHANACDVALPGASEAPVEDVEREAPKQRPFAALKDLLKH